MSKPLSFERPSADCHDAVRVPVYAMGQTDPATGAWTSPPLETIAIAIHLSRPGLFVLKMDNASMEPVIRRDAYVGIDGHDREPQDGRIMALNIAEEGLTLRRVTRVQDAGLYLLQAENPSHPDQRCPSDAPGLDIRGTVVWVIQAI